MKKIIMTIGLPFSGKSTLANQYEKKGWAVIERDKILKNLLESPEFKNELNKKCMENNITDREDIFKIENEIAIKMLNEILLSKFEEIESEKIFYDGTNLQKEGREGLLRLLNGKFDCEAMHLNLPIEEIKERAEKARKEREGQFNEGAYKNLERMIKMTDEPSISEGFSKILKLNEDEHVQEHRFKLK